MPDWELVVTEGDAPPEPDDDFAAHVTAAGFETRDPVTVALSIEADGSVTVSEGVPDWWDSDIQRCP